MSQLFWKDDCLSLCTVRRCLHKTYSWMRSMKCVNDTPISEDSNWTGIEKHITRILFFTKDIYWVILAIAWILWLALLSKSSTNVLDFTLQLIWFAIIFTFTFHSSVSTNGYFFSRVFINQWVIVVRICFNLIIWETFEKRYSRI